MMHRAASQPSGQSASSTHSYALLIVLMLAQIGTSCDNGAMSVAVTSLMQGLGASLADMQVANTVYALIAGAFMLAGGMLGIIIGWRKTLRIGLICAIAGEVFVASAPNVMVLTWVGRVLVGLGASLIIPSVLGMVPALYDGRRRAIAFSGIAGAAALATISPLPFGALVDAFGFRFTFLVLAVYFALVLIGTLSLPAAKMDRNGIRLDPGGIALAAIGIMFFLLGISSLPSWGVISPTSAAPFSLFGISPALPLAALGVVLLIALIPYEKRFEERYGCALIPRSYMTSPHVRSGLLAVLLPFFYLGAYLMLFMPYLQIVAGFSAMEAGLSSVLSTAPMFLLAISLPKLIPHVSSRLIIRIGFVLLALAFAFMGFGVKPGGVNSLLFAGLFVGGCGVGMVNSQANNAVASSVQGREAQQSGGIQGAARNIGLALGTALAGTVLLLTLSTGFSTALDAYPLDDAARAAVTEKASSLIGAQALSEAIVPYGLEAEEEAEILTAQASIQADSARFTFWLLGGITVLGLFGTRNLVETSVSRAPEERAERRQETSASRAAKGPTSRRPS